MSIMTIFNFYNTSNIEGQFVGRFFDGNMKYCEKKGFSPDIFWNRFWIKFTNKTTTKKLFPGNCLSLGESRFTDTKNATSKSKKEKVNQFLSYLLSFHVGFCIDAYLQVFSSIMGILSESCENKRT